MPRTRARRRVRLALAVAATGCLALTGAVAAPAGAAPGFGTERLSGADRYGTAAVVAEDYVRFYESEEPITYFLARGDSPTDALVASFLGTSGPLLLTHTGSLPAQTRDFLQRFGPQGVREVVVLGGSGAISDAVVAEVRGLGFSTRRVSGPDRFSTAVAVASETPQSEVDPLGEGLGDTAFLATGSGFADALAAGTTSCVGPPILLTERDSVPQVTVEAIGDRGLDSVVLLGGRGAISEAVEDFLTDQGLTVGRLQGSDRYETAFSITAFGLRNGLLDPSVLTLARGDTFPDALPAGPFGCGFPLVLTQPQSLPPGAQQQVAEVRPEVELGFVLGGPNAVSQAVVDDVTNRAR